MDPGLILAIVLTLAALGLGISLFIVNQAKRCNDARNFSFTPYVYFRALRSGLFALKTIRISTTVLYHLLVYYSAKPRLGHGG